MNIDKLDTIVLSRDDAIKILEWEYENHHKLDTIDFPLHEAVLVIKQKIPYMGREVELEGGLHFAIAENGIKLTVYDWRDKQKIASTIIGTGTDVANLDITMYYENPRMNTSMVKKDFHHQIMILLATMQYMNHYREYVAAKEVKQSIVKKSGKASSNSKRVVRFTKKQYSFDFSKEMPHEKRKHEYHVDSWKQRGFYRHYKKSGKVSWIGPQIKGPSKNKQPEPKVYKP